jgi:hypothetical protein
MTDDSLLAEEEEEEEAAEVLFPLLPAPRCFLDAATAAAAVDDGA